MRQLPAAFLIIALLAVPADAAAGAGKIETNKTLVRRMVEVINSRDLAALDGIVAPDLKRHSAATPGVIVRSREDFIEFLRQDFSAVPDSRLEIDLLLAEGDLVAGRFLYRGTQKGPWGPFPPSHRKVELPYISILRIDSGRIAEIWVEWDNMHALQQLGHFSPPGPPSAAEGPER